MNLGDGRIVLLGLSATFLACALVGVVWTRHRALIGAGTALDAGEAHLDDELVQTDSLPGAKSAADPDLSLAASQLAAALDAQASLFSGAGGAFSGAGGAFSGAGGAFSGAEKAEAGGCCFDNFSIGYLAGFVDAALHQLNLGSEARTLAALEIVAAHLTRPVAGAAAWLLQDLARLHAAGDSQFMRGLGEGATDARAWLRREIESPARWADYVLHEANA